MNSVIYIGYVDELSHLHNYVRYIIFCAYESISSALVHMTTYKNLVGENIYYQMLCRLTISSTKVIYIIMLGLKYPVHMNLFHLH